MEHDRKEPTDHYEALSELDADLPPDSHISVEQSISYWNGVDSSVSGMLGGYPQVSRVDLQGSRNFLAKLRRQENARTSSLSSPSPVDKDSKLNLAVDCGAGIGRVTAGFLSQIAHKVDIVEPVAKFTETLKQQQSSLIAAGVIGDIYNVGLESWSPSLSTEAGKGEAKKYDLIWHQWCLGHLTDAQLTQHLHRMISCLAPTGWIVVKENISSSTSLSSKGEQEDIYDEEDSSVTRSDAKFKSIFEQAGLGIMKMEMQTGFPKNLALLPVKMYALRPRKHTKGIEMET